jgi:transcriptional regulator with GAF, ATPase, and Fis domain
MRRSGAMVYRARNVAGTNRWGKEGAAIYSLEAMRKAHIEGVLQVVGYDLAKAARLLEVSPRTLRRLMRRLRIRG